MQFEECIFTTMSRLELFFSPTFTLIIFRFYFQKNQNRRMNPKGKKTHICKRKTWYGWYYITELCTKKKVWNNRDMPLKCMPLFTFTIRLTQDRDPESTKFNGQPFCLPQKDCSPFWEKELQRCFSTTFKRPDVVLLFCISSCSTLLKVINLCQHRI